MARTAAFEANTVRYDQWFVRHDGAYLSELSAVRSVLPTRGLGLEVGVGTGRFAAALGVPVGVDPSVNMLHLARGRDLRVVCGIAEALPFSSRAFDYVLIVTTICFVDDPKSMLNEARRVLKPQGHLVIGFIDRESRLGRDYVAHQSENVFYRDATFYSVSDVEALVLQAGFEDLNWAQTLCQPTVRAAAIERARSGHGEGSFVVVRAARSG